MIALTLRPSLYCLLSDYAASPFSISMNWEASALVSSLARTPKISAHLSSTCCSERRLLALPIA